MSNQSLFLESEDYTRRGWYTIPILEKEPPKGCTWTDKKGKIADVSYREKYFCYNDDVKRFAILLDSNRLGFAVDVDGAKALQIFQRKILPRLSQQLQDKINRTTHTKTANSGYHWVFEIQRKDFPKGISQRQYWIDRQNKHGEIKLIGTNQYVIERGMGYQPIRGIESLATLTQQEANDFLSVLDAFDRETKAILNVSSKLHKYYVPTNRQNLVLRVAGYLHKHQVPEYLTCELIFHMMGSTADDEPVKRKSAIMDTYVKDANTDQVSGRIKLLEAVDGEESVITAINQEFGKLGYLFNGNGNENANGQKRGDETDSEEKKSKLSTKILKLLEPYVMDLFTNQFDMAFAAVSINNHRETLPIIKSRRFEFWILKMYWDLEHKTMGSETLTEVCKNLGSKALFSDHTYRLDVRVSRGPDDNSIYYYDLCNKIWQVVKITKTGWSVENASAVPIMFRRFSAQKAQVYPANSRSYPSDIFERFMDLINIKDGNSRLLLKCYIISLFIPNISKAALMLHGPKGSAKTACEDLIKDLVDPSPLENLDFPAGKNELAQQLYHNYVAYYDNVSSIGSSLSNALCRAITGGAQSKRELYTDDDDVLYQFERCIGFNSIVLAANKADLLDRGLIIELSRIDSKKIRDFKGDILPAFQRLKPQLLAYILDILVEVLKLKSKGGITLETKSRMADWEIHAEMISRCMGNKPLEFINAYHENKKLGTGEVLEGSPVAKALMEFMEDKKQWGEGSGSLLLSELEPVATKIKINIQRDPLWPKNAQVLSRRIKEIKTNLLDVNIEVIIGQHPTKRTTTYIIKNNALDALDPLDPTESRSETGSKNEGNCEGNIETENRNALDLEADIHAQEDKIEGNEGNEGITSNDKGGDHIFRPRPYSDFIVDGIPIWQKENRGMTQEEEQAFRNEVERLKSSKVADMAKANLSGNGIM